MATQPKPIPTKRNPKTNKPINPTSHTNIRPRMHRIIPPLQRLPSQPLLQPKLQNTIHPPNNNENNKTNPSRRRNNMGLRNNRNRHDQLLIHMQLRNPRMQRNNKRSKIQTTLHRLATSQTLTIKKGKQRKIPLNSHEKRETNKDRTYPQKNTPRTPPKHPQRIGNGGKAF